MTSTVAVLASTPCRATTHGCSSDNLVGVLLIVLLIGAAGIGAMAWVWFRWERGPFWTVMRLLSRTPRERGPRR
jgi:hypothetical protein